MSERKIVVLGTGGTIAGRALVSNDNIGYTAGAVGVDQLLHGLPRPDGIEIHAEQVAQIDSKDMTQVVWLRLLQRTAYWLAQTDVAGIVVTHGTDTLEETAWFMQLALSASGLLVKPVVLTCAMRPASALVPDGPQNLLDALAVVDSMSTNGSISINQPLSVVAVCAGKVHAAVDVQKRHPYQVDAFNSGDAGPLAFVEEGRVRWLRSRYFQWESRHVHWPDFSLDVIALDADWPRVVLMFSHAGVDGYMLHLLLRERSLDKANGMQGLVLASTGNGTVHEELLVAANQALSTGVRVVRASRCPEGRILALASDATPDSEGLSPVKARIALMLELLHQQNG